MASQGNLHSEHAKIEQIITQFFAKSLHIILESRSPFVSSRNFSGEQTGSSPSSLSSSSSLRPRDKWFNLALRDCPAVLENLELWRRNTLEPLVVDVILVQRAANVEMGCSPGAMPKVGLFRNPSSKERLSNFWNSGEDDFPSELQRETVIERWIVQYENRKSNVRDLHLGRMCPSSGHGRHDDRKKMGGNSRDGKGRGNLGRDKETGSGLLHSSEGPAAYKRTYKRSIILLRSLYLFVRLLPAYKIFRHLNSSNKIYSFSLNYKVMSFVEPLSRAEEAEMQQFTFVPVDTPYGRLCLSVSYRPTLSEVNLEASTPLSPQLILDYVGSPTTNPLKRFSSGPLVPSSGKKVVDAAFLPLAGERPPSSAPFTRRHSWSNDLHNAIPYSSSPPFYPHSFSPSPSPDPRASPSNLSGHKLPPLWQPHMDHSSPVSSPRHPFDTPRLADTSLSHKKETSFDDYWISPPFTPSLSPSPPTHLPGNHLSNALLRSESAPVRIPALGYYDRDNIQPPSSSPKCMLPGNLSPANNFNSHIFRASPDGKLHVKSDASRPGKCQIGLTSLQTYSVQKALTYGNEEVGIFPEMRISSSSSPRISVSRSSSRLSLQDEFDDLDFPCPFDITDLHNRSDSFDRKGPFSETTDSGPTLPVGKSRDAAVGALVHMLQTAPPLRQDSSNSIKPSQRVEPWGESMQLNATPVDLRTTVSDPGITASEFVMPMTTSHALEELRGFSEMKEMLLRQGGSHSLDIAAVAKNVERGSTEI